MEPHVAGALYPPPVARHLDPAAGARVRARTRRGSGAPETPRGPCSLCVEPSEPYGRAGDPARAARALARAPGDGDAEGVLQGALHLVWIHLAAAVHELAELL